MFWEWVGNNMDGTEKPRRGYPEGPTEAQSDSVGMYSVNHGRPPSCATAVTYESWERRRKKRR